MSSPEQRERIKELSTLKVLGAPWSIVHVDPPKRLPNGKMDAGTYVRCTRCNRYLADVYVRPDGVFGSTCIHHAGGHPTEVYTMVRDDGKSLVTEDGRTVESTILKGGPGEV